MRKQTNTIRIIYFLKFFADALFCGYMSMFFLTFFDKFSWQYSVLLGVIPFCTLIGNFLWGLISKNVIRNLFIIKIVLILELTGLLLLTFLGGNFITLLIFTIFVSLFNSPYFTLQDGLGSAYSKKEGKSYISIRVLGSSGYLCALAIGSLLIKIFNENYQIIFSIAAVIYLICLILWFFIKPFDDLNEKEKEKIKYIEVLKNKTFILYFFSYLLILGCHSVADSYLFVRLNEVGVTSSTYSLVFASEVLLEIISMVIVFKFIKEKYHLMVLKISIIFLFLRTFLMGFNFPKGLLIAIAPLRGIGWGLFLSTHLITVRKIVSNKLVVKAISILTIALAIVNGTFTLIGSSIYSKISLPTFYFLLSGIMLIGIIIMYLMKFRFTNERNKEDTVCK